MKNKKLFAILTLVCFMLTLMPVAAFAGNVDDQTSYVLTVKDNPTIKVDGNAEITFDFDGASATTVYVWFLKDGASVPSNKVAVNANGDNAGAISIAENNADANIFEINAVQAEEYSFIFSDAGEYKVKASLDIAADKTVGSSVVSSSNIGHPLQNIATQSTITVKENNAATSKYKMVDVNGALKEATATADGYIVDGEAVELNGLTANNASTKTVKLQLLDEKGDAVKCATMSIEAGSANVTVSKTTATTNALGQFSFDVTAAREGEYKIYVGTGSYEATIIVNAGTTAAATIVLETAPQAPTALDDDYTSNDKGLTGKIGFRIYDAAGSEVKSASNAGITNATNSITTSSDDAKNFVALTSKPAASDLDSENFEIAWKGDEYGWTIVMDETFDEEGTYEFKVVLDNGAYATASIEVKEMGTPVGIVITYYTDAVELGASITPRAINWIV